MSLGASLRVLFFLLLNFAGSLALAKNELEVLKPCLELLEKSPNSAYTPRPRGNSIWLGDVTQINTMGGPVSYSFNALVLPVRKTVPPPHASDFYEFHILQTNPKGQLTIRKFSASNLSISINKGAVFPIGSTCTKSFFAKMLPDFEGCRDMPLAISTGTVTASRYNPKTDKMEESKIILSQLLLDEKEVKRISESQKRYPTLKEMTTIDKYQTLSLLFKDIARHLTYILERDKFTQDESGRKLILNTIQTCKDSYIELLSHDVAQTSAGGSLYDIANALELVKVNKNEVIPRSPGIN